MLFMFQDKEPPVDLQRPDLKNFAAVVKMNEVESVFDELDELNLTDHDRRFVASVKEDYEKYNSVTSKQWPVLIKIKDKYENQIGVS